MKRKTLIANNLRRLRKERGLTLEEVAALANTTHQTIQKLETGQRKITDQWLSALANALEVHPYDILQPGKPGAGPNDAELLRRFRALTAEQQDLVIGLMDQLAPDTATRGRFLHEQRRLPATDHNAD